VTLLLLLLLLCYKYICVTEREGHVDHDAYVDVLSYCSGAWFIRLSCPPPIRDLLYITSGRVVTGYLSI